MQQPEIIFYIIKLVFAGIIAFLAILLLSKTREPAWLCLCCACIIFYAGLIYEMLLKIGIASDFSLRIAGIPLFLILATAIPSLLVIIAFVLMIARSGR